MGFVNNAWYVADWSTAFQTGLVARRLLDQPVVFYRKPSGDLVALQDRCPHRFVPLHVGVVEGETLRCGYHGLAFGPTGACVENPHGEGQISRNMVVRSYPVAERDGLAWIWMGAPDLADPDKIPAFPFLADPDRYTTTAGYIEVQANYQLINDNLLDLSHTQFVHPIFRRDGAYQPVEMRMEQVGDALHLRGALHDVAPYAFARLFTDLERVDNFRNTTWRAPSSIHLDFGVMAPGAPREAAVEFPSVHLLTPASEGVTHYFWAMSRNRRLDDDALSARVRDAITSAFVFEDKPLIEMQQHHIGDADLMTLQPVLLQTDATAIRARRIVADLMRREQPQCLDRREVR